MRACLELDNMADSNTDDELLLAINASVVAVIALEEIQENSSAHCKMFVCPYVANK